MATHPKRPAAPAFHMPVPVLPGGAVPPQKTGPAPIGREPNLTWHTVMRVKAIYLEYLECEGWDPRTGGYVKTVNVAKPFLLRDAAADDSPGADPEVVKKIRFPDYDREVEMVSLQKRIATYSNGKEGSVQQEVSPPYFVGDLLVAARIHGWPGSPAAVSPRSGTVSSADNVQQTPDEVSFPDDYAMKFLRDSDGSHVFWMDLNVAGRRWQEDATQAKRFELKGALTPGGSATAHPLPWTGAAYVVDTDADKEFEVYDVLGKFRGRAKDAYGSPHNQGSQGYARLMPDSGRWELTDLTPNALLIRGTAKVNWPTPGPLEIQSVAVMQPTGGLITNTDPAGDIPVTDFFNWGGVAGDDVFAVWDEAAEAWKMIQKVC